ncbi:MAG: RES family NAD+ phosphorylase [Roseibium sp.]
MTADAIASVRTVWPKAYRIIRTLYPPVDLFEDIADPSDWEALASAESKTNPRIWESIGRLDLVPPERRVTGEGSSFLMAPFVHVSPDRPGRFTDGSYGVYSAGNSEEVALREVAYHHGQTMRASSEDPGWTSQFRVLINSLDLDLHDLRQCADCHASDDYTRPQDVGRNLRLSLSNGVLYNSVRAPDGLCTGIFWPDLIPIPVQGDHYEFHWDGKTVDRVLNLRTRQIFGLG